MNESHQLDESTWDMRQQKLADKLPDNLGMMQYKGNTEIGYTPSFGDEDDPKFVPLNMQPLKQSKVGKDAGSDEEEKI